MADPALIAALKLRQQQAEQERNAAMARQNMTDQTMSPWATMGQGALDTLSDYASGVYDAAMPQIERAAKGFGELTGAAPMPTGNPITDSAQGMAAKILKGKGVDAVNNIADLGFGAANTAFSPLAPPMNAVLKPALDTDAGQAAIGGVQSFNQGVSDLTGITPENIGDAEMWLGLPLAGKALGKGLEAGVSRAVKALDEGAAPGRGVEAPQGVQPPKQDAPAAAQALSPVEQFDQAFSPVEQFDQAFSPVEQFDQGIEATPSTMRDIGLKAADDMPSSGDHLASQYRDWAKDAGGTIDDALSALESEKQAWDAGLYNEAVGILAKEAEAEAVPRRLRTNAQSLAKEYRQAAKDHGLDAVKLLDDERSAWSPELHKATRDLLTREELWPTQSVQALVEPPAKGGPASAEVKVKPGQSLWDTLAAAEEERPMPAEFGERHGADIANDYLKYTKGDVNAAIRQLVEEQTAWSPKEFEGAMNTLRPLQRRAAMQGEVAPAPRVPTLEDFQNVPMPKDQGQALPPRGGEPLEFDPSNGRTVPPTTSVMPEGMMHGDPSGYKNVNIRTNPSLKDVGRAIEENKSWHEARYLIEPDGAMHFWPANGAFHNDVGEFLGADADNGYHGTMTRRQYDAAMEHNPKTLEDLVRLSGDHYLDSWIQDMGLANRQEWRDAGQAYIDSFNPKPKTLVERFKALKKGSKALPKEELKQPEPQLSPVEQFDSGAVDQPVEAPPKTWQERQARARAEGQGKFYEAYNQSQPRGKGEPLISMRGYTERQAKMVSPLDELDGNTANAAAKRRSAQMLSYKADQPEITRPERASKVKEAFRQQWLDPNRPVHTETDTPALPNINRARKGVDAKFIASRKEAFNEHEGDITPKILMKKVGDAIKDHLAMTPEQRRINLMLAEKKLLKYMPDPNGNGRPSDFMNENKKLLKTREGYDGQDPVTLPNGQGIESTGLSLSPSTEVKGFKTCPNSAACREACLGLKSGQYYLSGEDGGPQAASRYRTTALLSFPEASAVKIFEEIAARQRKAASNGNILGVRMNVLSDVDPQVWKPLMDHFKDAVFYDYTKMKYEPVAPNHQYTYSSTGVSSDMVSNKNANWSQMRDRLDSGDNVAMAFSTKEAFPKWVVDEATGKRYRVVDGVSHDFRPIDMQNAGKEGVIVGLKNMDLTTKEATAHETSGGFIVHYDPQWKRAGRKLARDESGNPIAQNDTVYIQDQGSKESRRSPLPGQSGVKTGPQTQISIRGEDRTPVQNMKALTLEDVSPKEELKQRAQATQDIVDRMYARLNMFDHAPKMDKNQPRKLFSEEYPDWNGEDHGTRVETDMDGQPINPDAMIVGRQTKGGVDKGHSPRAYKAMAERMMDDFNPENNRGVFRRKNEKSMIGGTFKFKKGSQTGKTYPEGIEINSATPEWLQDQTLAHEIGHMIDFMSTNAADKYFKHVNSRTGGEVTKYDPRGMPTRDLMKPVEYELRDLYSEVNENFGTYQDHRKGMPNTPERSGYGSHLAPSELIAEAFRVYMYDPGYIKARYPKAAEFLRQIVRDNPQVAKHIHFNEMGGGIAAATMAAKIMAARNQDQEGQR